MFGIKKKEDKKEKKKEEKPKKDVEIADADGAE